MGVPGRTEITRSFGEWLSGYSSPASPTLAKNVHDAFHPTNPGPQIERVLREAPAMEGPTPTMEGLRILRADDMNDLLGP